MKTIDMSPSDGLLTRIEKRPVEDVWAEIERMANETGEEVWIWGAGSVAAGVTKQLKGNTAIRIAGYFVDVEGENYAVDDRLLKDNPTIATLNELNERREKIIVVVGHSRYELVERVERVDIVDKVFIVPASVRLDDGFDCGFFYTHSEDFEKAYSLLSDQKSKNNMVAFVNAKVNQDESYIGASRVDGYFDNDVFKPNDDECYIDVGAFHGEITDLFLRSQKKYKSISVIEVQEAEYQNLLKKYIGVPRLQVANVGISDHVGVDHFEFDSQSTCISPTGSIEVPVETLDSFSAKRRIDPTIVKMCIGGSIMPILEGARSIIGQGHAVFIIHIGINRYSFQHCIQYMNAISEEKYEFYLRFSAAMSECLILYAVPRSKSHIQ